MKTSTLYAKVLYKRIRYRRILLYRVLLRTKTLTHLAPSSGRRSWLCHEGRMAVWLNKWPHVRGRG